MKPIEIIKLAPKLQLNRTGIYFIYCVITEKVYVGHTKSIDGFGGRFNRHKSELTRSIHGNCHLQNAWNKYGSESFLFYPIEAISKNSPVKLFDEIEEAYINLFHNHQLFNLIRRPTTKEPSQESREKLSSSLKEYYKTHPNPMLGRKLTDEQLVHRSVINSGKNNPMYGRKHSSESRTKMSINQHHTEEQRMMGSLYLRKERAIEFLKKENKEISLENINHLLETKYKNKSTLTAEIVTEARRLRRETNMKLTDIAKKYNVAIETMRSAITGESWKHLPNAFHIDRRKKENGNLTVTNRPSRIGIPRNVSLKSFN